MIGWGPKSASVESLGFGSLAAIDGVPLQNIESETLTEIDLLKQQVAELNSQLKTTYEQAYSEGFDEATAIGESNLKSERKNFDETLAKALSGASDAFALTIDSLQQISSRIALLVVKKLTSDPTHKKDLLIAMIDAQIRQLAGDKLCLFVSPSDFPELEGLRDQLQLASHKKIEVYSSDTLKSGQIRASIDSTTHDVGFDAQLRTLSEALCS